MTVKSDSSATMSTIGEDRDNPARGQSAASRPAAGEISLEPADVADLGAILEIEQASFSSPWTESMLRAEIEGNQFARFILARRKPERDILGYVCYWIVFDELRILNVAVAPAARRQGTARMLVEHAVAAGRAHGVGRVLLEVRASNEPAVSLYRSLGFARTALRKNYYRDPYEDAILMELRST